MNAYKDYVLKWISGIQNEIDYWDSYMETRGALYQKEAEFKEYTDLNRTFLLENEISAPVVHVLDVGSGPFSTCGLKTDQAKLHLTAVDMLSPVYQQLKRQHGIQSDITPVFGLMDTLEQQFGAETYDIVHISNALDHTFDPMMAIWQLLAVCKIGGKLILEHHQNEAEAAGYQGLHQWNCTLENGKFEIWNLSDRIDVAKNVGDYANFYLERHAPLDKVVITKLRSSPCIQNPHFCLLIEEIMKALELQILQNRHKTNES